MASGEGGAGIVGSFLKGVAEGFFESPYLRDYTHASKTFRNNNYAYTPKFKYLFHTYFDINTDYIGATNSFPTDRNFGLAVKTIQLPKYSFDLHELNQYNRRRIVQTKIKYDPIQITFHDDNANLIRQLWYTYYTYYYKDATQQEMSGASSNYTGLNGTQQKYDYNKRNIYQADISDAPDWGYIGAGTGDVPTPLGASTGRTKVPFFRAINIFGFNQHNYVLYRVINPILDSFTHDTYDYSNNSGIMECSMSVRYETVKYYNGALNGQNPSEVVNGFGVEDHYDRTLSPIARPGSNASILGEGGLVDTGVGIVEDLQSGNILGAIQKAGRGYNTFKGRNLGKILAGDVIGNAQDAISQTPNSRNIFNFPR